MLITERGVPERFIEIDVWGGGTMARLDDGWCAALNRDTLMCRIYAQRLLICRESATGKDECVAEPLGSRRTSPRAWPSSFGDVK
jgi:Fe-S-cluster containining protein